MSQDNVTYEYGYRFDLRKEKDVKHYLELSAQWLDRVHYPRDVESFTDFVNRWCHNRHRKLAIDVLTHAGHRVAALFASALSGKLTQKRMDEWRFEEAQSLEIIFAVWLFMQLTMLGVAWYFKKQIMQIADVASTTFNNVVVKVNHTVGVADQAATGVEKLLNVAGSMSEAILSAGKNVLEFFNSAVTAVMEKIRDIPLGVVLILKGLVKVILIFVAFEYARTIFPDLYSALKSYLCTALGYTETTLRYDADVEAQAGGEPTYMEDILNFVNKNFIKGPSNFLEYFGPLHRATSIARSIEWLMKHLGSLIGWVVEIWTKALC